MTGEIAILLGILGAAVFFFVTGWLRVDLVGLLVLISLALTGLVTPQEALAGFSNPAVVTVWGVFILSGGLSRTGVAGMLGRRILHVAGSGQRRLVLVIMLAAGCLSAFMNNVGVAALLFPVVMDIARRTDLAPSKLLMPLSFGCLLGGLTTLIGTPPNILVTSALRDYGLQPFQLFDFTPVGLAVMLSGVAFMAFLGRHLLPLRHPAKEAPIQKGIESHDLSTLKEHLFIVHVAQRTLMGGRTLEESRLGARLGLNVIALLRGGKTFLAPDAGTVLHEGDQLIVEGKEEQIEALESLQDLEIEKAQPSELADLESDIGGFTEAVLSPHTSIAGKSLQDLNFREKYGLNVVGLCRQGRILTENLRDEPLHLGDGLLLHGPWENMKMLGREPDFLVLTVHAEEPPRLKKAPLAVLAMAVFVIPVILGWFPVYLGAVTGAAFTILLGCLTMEEAYRAISWRAVFLIAGMLPLGVAIEKTGAAQLVAEHLLGLIGDFGDRGIVAGLFIVTAFCAQIMPTSAVAILIAPIALDTALDMNVAPQALMMTVAISASASFMSPVAHPANVMVMGPGGYRFSDYTKVGVPLTAVCLLVVLFVLPVFWPLSP
jgi:di/tricarboxylate transporter